MTSLGKTTSGSTTTSSSANKTVVSPFTAAASGVLQTGSVRIAIDSGSATVRVVVYRDSAGSPGALLAQSDPITVTNTTATFVSGSFTGTNQASIVSGVKYHIGAAWTDPGTPTLTYDRDNTASQRFEQTSDRPDPFGTPSLTSGGPIAAYVDYAARTVTWSGYTWDTRVETGTAPGPNEWGAGPANISTSGSDLTITIAQVGGVWTCPELIRQGGSLGYGRYRWTYTIDWAALDIKPVLGLFTYETDTDEIDIEVSKWNASGETSGMWYTNQPGTDSSASDHIVSGATPYTSEYVWESGQIYWRTLDANGVLLGEHVVNENIPAAGAEGLHANFWLQGGSAPTNSLPVSATLHSFDFTPSATHALAKANSYIDDFSRLYEWAVKGTGSITGGELVLPCTSTYNTSYLGSILDLTSSNLQIEVTAVPAVGTGTTEAQWHIRHDDNNEILTYWAAGGLFGRLRQGGVNSADQTLAASYNSTTHRFWRVLHSGSTITWQTAPDGVNWTTRGSLSTTLTTAQLQVMRCRFDSGYYGTETTPGNFQITQVGTAAAASTPTLPTMAPPGRIAPGGEWSPLWVALASDTPPVSVVPAGDQRLPHAPPPGRIAPTGRWTPWLGDPFASTSPSAAATLGRLVATASGSRATSGTAAATFGRLAATASGTRAFSGSAAASLGGLTAFAVGTISGPLPLLLPRRTQLDYEVQIVARIPALSGPPALMVVDPIQWTSLEWKTELSTPQSLDVTCAISTISEPILQRFRNPAALATELWLLRHGQIVFAGPLTGGRRDGETLSLHADGLLSYLARMFIYRDMVFSQVDQATIVKTFVDVWQDEARGIGYGNYGIDTSAVGTTGILRDGTYLKTELHQVLQRVQDIGKRSSGFDVDIEPASRQLRVWFPSRGVDRSTGEDAIVFDARNITNTSTMFSVGPNDVASYGLGTGTASDGTAGTLFQEVQSPTVLAQFGLSGITGTWDSVSEPSTLYEHVNALLLARDEALFVPGPNIQVTPDADLSLYDVGDTVHCDVDNQLGVTGSFRLRSIKVSVDGAGKELITPTFV